MGGGGLRLCRLGGRGGCCGFGGFFFGFGFFRLSFLLKSAEFGEFLFAPAREASFVKVDVVKFPFVLVVDFDGHQEVAMRRRHVSVFIGDGRAGVSVEGGFEARDAV
jgi:hypothetical protein